MSKLRAEFIVVQLLTVCALSVAQITIHAVPMSVDNFDGATYAPWWTQIVYPSASGIWQSLISTSVYHNNPNAAQLGCNWIYGCAQPAGEYARISTKITAPTRQTNITFWWKGSSYVAGYYVIQAVFNNGAPCYQQDFAVAYNNWVQASCNVSSLVVGNNYPFYIQILSIAQPSSYNAWIYVDEVNLGTAYFTSVGTNMTTSTSTSTSSVTSAPIVSTITATASPSITLTTVVSNVTETLTLPVVTTSTVYVSYTTITPIATSTVTSTQTVTSTVYVVTIVSSTGTMSGSMIHRVNLRCMIL
jgi:hypothetical protein